jgi:hypothetical protein
VISARAGTLAIHHFRARSIEGTHSHSDNPDVHLIDRYSHHHLLPEQIGEVEVIVDWDDLMRIVVFSLVVFDLVWCVARLGPELRKLIVNPYEVSSHERGGKKIVQPRPPENCVLTPMNTSQGGQTVTG